MSCVEKSTSLCFETLRSKDGQIDHLLWHQKRFDATRHKLFGQRAPLWLSENLHPPKTGSYRIKVSYAQTIESIAYIPYVPRTWERFGVCTFEGDYAHKWVDRSALEGLIHNDFDEMILLKEGFLTDTTRANIALMINGVWLTPASALLEGTTRARLLASGQIKAAFLDRNALKIAQKFAIMNALIGFQIIDKERIVE